MSLRIGHLAIVSALILSTGAHAQSSYLCIEEFAGGIKFNQAAKKWFGTAFHVDGKYVVSQATQSNAHWTVTELGQSWAAFTCEKDFDDRGFISCTGVIGEFDFNRVNLRFLRMYPFGFINDQLNPGNPKSTEGGDSPAIVGGICSPLRP